MVLPRKTVPHNRTIETEQVKKVTHFKYYRTILKKINKIDRVINECIGKVRRIFHSLKAIVWGNREIPKETKVEILKNNNSNSTSWN